MSLKILMEDFSTSLSRFSQILSPRCMYIAALSSLLYAAFADKGILPSHGRLLKSQLLAYLPSPVKAAVTHGPLHELASNIVSTVDRITSDRTTVELVEGRADLDYILKMLSRELGSVRYIVLYDCLSIPELLTMASSLRARGYEAIFSSLCFLNPVGLTRFVTKQAPPVEATMRDVLRVFMEALGAENGSLVREVDRKVHEYGFDLKEFFDNVNIEKVISKCETYANRGSTLVVSDHGYDVFYDSHGLYVSHGPIPAHRICQTALNFSKIAPIMVVFKRW